MAGRLKDKKIDNKLRIEFNCKYGTNLTQDQYDKLCSMECTNNFCWVTNIISVLKTLNLI